MEPLEGNQSIAGVTGKSGETKGGCQRVRHLRSSLFTCGSPFTPDKLYWGSVTTSPSNVLSPTLAPHSPADPIPQAPACG